MVFGNSDAMQALRSRLYKVASANVPILIQGERGTGKDVIARMIHDSSPWKSGPFVKAICLAISGTLLERELFGYEKGAFAGAYGTKPGRVEMAHRGTLFLDEISKLDLALQSKLLQLLQDGQFCRSGAQENKKVEVRIVCATNRQLEIEIENGAFRKDLRLPPLRERRGDIEGLVHYFLEHYKRKYNCRVGSLSGELLAMLQKHHWSGNIHELENLIKRYVILGSEDVISNALVARSEQEFLNPEINLNGPISLKKLTRELEGKVILKVLEAHRWNRKQAARALCISYRGLLYKIRNTGLCPNQ
jgi:two-component system response regulator AtoC